MTYTLGSSLLSSTRADVLRRFVHRWTHENAKQTYGGRCPACEQSTNAAMSREAWHAYHAPMVSDTEWLAAHSFVTRKDGSLDNRYKMAYSSIFAERAS